MSDRQVLAKGVFWSAIEKYSSLGVSIIISMILARLLTPTEFGTVAIALVLIQFMTMVSSMGIAPAIIQRRDLSESDLNDIFTFSCIVGLILALIFFSSSWIVAELYEVPVLVTICQILSIQVFFSAANMVPNALMQKNLRFKEIAKRTLLLQILTGLLAIVAAFLGAGVFALLISPVITSIGIFIFNRRYYRVNISKHFSINPIKKIFSYSSYQFLSQFIVYFSANTDKLLIGKYISAGDLGYYQKSHQLVQQPIGSVGAVVNPVLQPVLTKYQDNKGELARRYNRIIRLLATISFPIGMLMFFCGSEIIRLFYGSQWDLAVPAFKIISITAPIQIVLSSSGSFFQAANETKKLFQLGTINAVITILSTIVSLTLYKSIEAVAWAWSISNVIGLLITYYFMYVLILRRNIIHILKEFIPPVLLAIGTAVVLYFENIILCNYYISAFIVKILTALTIIALSLHISKQINIVEGIRECACKLNKHKRNK